MADTQRFASQERFNEKINPWSPTTFGVKMADAATFGYLPTIVEKMWGVPQEFTRKAVDAASEENPVASGLGTTAGYVYDTVAGAAALGMLGAGGAAAAPSAYAARLGLTAAPKAAPVAAQGVARIAQMLGPAAARANAVQAGRNVMALAKMGWKPVAGLASLVGGPALVNQLVGADTDAQKNVDPNAPTAPAREQAAADNPPEPPKPISYEDYWGNALGMRPEDVSAVAQRYGGIPLSMVQTMAQARPNAPAYKSVALGNLMDALNAEAAQLSNADPEAKARFRDKFAKIMAETLGVDPNGQAFYDEQQ